MINDIVPLLNVLTQDHPASRFGPTGPTSAEFRLTTTRVAFKLLIEPPRTKRTLDMQVTKDGNPQPHKIQ